MRSSVRGISLLLVAAGAGFGARGLLAPSRSSADVPSLAFATKRATVAARGRIQPVAEVLEVAAPANDRIERVLVSEGDAVVKDAPLALLESHAERLLERDRVATVLSETLTRLATETALGEANVAEAKLRIERAETLSPLQVDSEQAAVRAAEATLRFARQQLDRHAHLREGQVGTPEAYEQKVLAVDDGEASLARARDLLGHAEATRGLDLRLARAQLATAEASLERARGQVPANSLRCELSLAEERLRRTEVRAPSEGRILKVLSHAGEASGARPLLRMGDVRRMAVIAEVYETDARFVSVGQKARITSPALPAELAGVVDRVGTIVARNAVLETDPAADADARVVEVRVRIDDGGVAARFVNLQCIVRLSVLGDGE
jgi:HlyD family secretion protein